MNVMKPALLFIFLPGSIGAVLAATEPVQATLPQIDAKYAFAPGQRPGCGLRGTVQQLDSKTMICDDSGKWVEIKANLSAQHSLVLRLSARGCIARDPHGEPLKLDNSPNSIVKIARGSTFSAACFVER